jgi:hypothetical protein
MLDESVGSWESTPVWCSLTFLTGSLALLRNRQPLRLPSRHAATESAEVTAEDGARIAADQSFRNAVTASLVVIVIFAILWVMLTRVTDRVFPWMTVLLGVVLGYAIRRAGGGVDWRFPSLAAAMAVFGSLLANVVVAAANTAASMGTGTLQILQAVTTMTWPVFFGETLSAADYVFALFAAVLAAFFANRRLSRSEYRAVRLFKESL